METFWRLFEESVITQSIMTVLLWGTACALMLECKPVPDLLSAGSLAILGFWFGSKLGYKQGVTKSVSDTAVSTPHNSED